MINGKMSSKVSKKAITLLLTGAPGVGKGTFGKRLSRDLRLPSLSIGDFLRNLLRDPNCNDPDIVRIRNGELLGDEKVISIVKTQVAPDTAVILDGFPRNLTQAEWLDSYKHIDLVVNFDMNRTLLVEKLAGRRVCPVSGETYNVFQIKKDGYDMDPLLPAKDPTRCDKSGELLVQRDDDRPEIIRRRLEIYDEETAPLFDYYDKQGKLFTFEPKRGVKDYPSILEEVSNLLKSQSQKTR
jgi:adenylate kinase